MHTGATQIDRATAKDELARIDALLKAPLLLIGGLAVQQYHDARPTRDIDLVCDHATVQSLVAALYPTKFWDSRNLQSDDRPNYLIKHKSKSLTVYFGPKIIERGQYKDVAWHELAIDALPFRHKGDTYLQNIRVPLPHYLAYSKLISFLSRRTDPKSAQDLEDFVNLTNHKLFSISELYDTICRNGAEARVMNEMKEALGKDPAAQVTLTGSCIDFFAGLWPTTSGVDIAAQQLPTPEMATKTVYLAAPHKNCEQNNVVRDFLADINMSVILPADEVEKECGTPSPTNAELTREICIEAIVASDGIIVDTDRYGLDTAWEIGYAEGSDKFVIGFAQDPSSRNLPRMVNRRLYRENFMHGWATQKTYTDLTDFVKEFADAKIYVCGPFHNTEIRKVRRKTKALGERIIFPMDYVPKTVGMPRDYPLQTRTKAIHQIDGCDVLAVVLPRYGMDAAWQIGYASAKKKTIVGLLMRDDGNSGSAKTLWDHWMHGWTEKDIFSGLPKMRAALKGYISSGILV